MTSPRRHWLALLSAVFAVTLTTGALRAETTLGAPSASLAAQPSARSSEFLRGVGQVAAGSLVAAGSAYLTFMAADRLGEEALLLFLAAPVAVGGAVCFVGNTTSSANRSACAPTIGGAYVGTLSMIPLGLLGAWIGSRQEGNSFDEKHHDSMGSIALGLAAGWVLVQPLVSTYAWHHGKRPRTSASPARAVAPTARLGTLSHERTRAVLRPGTFVMPLMAGSF